MSGGRHGAGDVGESAPAGKIFADAADRQYERHLLFSQLVAVLSAVATRASGSVHASYLAHQDRLDVTASAPYDKLKGLEPPITAALVRETAADAAKAIDALPGGLKSVLPGRKVYYLDGNHLAATEHRIAELRTTREGPRPA